MGMTKGDYEFYQGWRAGAETMIDAIRQSLLELEQDEKIVPLAVFEVLNWHKDELHGKHSRKADIPPCEDEADLVFYNID